MANDDKKPSKDFVHVNGRAVPAGLTSLQLSAQMGGKLAAAAWTQYLTETLPAKPPRTSDALKHS